MILQFKIHKLFKKQKYILIVEKGNFFSSKNVPKSLVEIKKKLISICQRSLNFEED